MHQSLHDGSDVVVVGAGPGRHTFQPGAVGTLAGFGVPMDVRLPGAVEAADEPPDRARMPLSLTVGAWLMSQVGSWHREDSRGRVRAESVPTDADTSGALSLGREIAASSDEVALVVMGDGSSALSVKAPGYLVPGAEQWQNVVSAAIAAAEVDTLAALVPADADRFGAAGRAAWQVLAGAAAAGGAFDSELLAAEDRYGVAYLVAHWRQASSQGVR